jgi:hypothetical protein
MQMQPLELFLPDVKQVIDEIKLQPALPLRFFFPGPGRVLHHPKNEPLFGHRN